MNATANTDAMTAILRQISLDWNVREEDGYVRPLVADGGHGVHSR